MATYLTSNLTQFTTIQQTVSFLLRNANSYDINAASTHEPISYGATLAYQQVASMIPETVPVILESIISAEFIDDEIEAAHEALATDGPRPRVRKRRSSETPRLVRA